MIYSSRLKKILELCLIKDEYIKVDTLAEQLKISSRTVFRELKDIGHDLKEYGLSLVSKPGKGIRILGEQTSKDALLQELDVSGIQYLNKEERQRLLTFELLHKEACEKLIHYANLFQVSEATISNDLDMLASWFQEHQLRLNRKPGYGIEVIGSEARIRQAMTDILHQNLMEQEDFERVNVLDSQTLLEEIFLINGDSIMKLLNQEILIRILQVFTTYQHELNLDRYAQISYIGLIIHLVIAVDRIMKQEQISEHQQVIDLVKDDPSYEQARQMAEYLECEFDIDIPKVEIAFIALHIKGAKMTKISYDTETPKELEQLQLLIEEMLDSYDEAIAIYLKQDEELYHGLLTHLGPTLTRLQHHLPIYNPLLKQIKQEYQLLYEQTKQACTCLCNAFHCDISEDEIGFITMHIGAALERAKQGTAKKRIVKLGVVCASGIGVSALLSARIQKAFSTFVEISVLSMDDILQERYRHCEFLVSTFLVEVLDKRVLLVTPLLNEADIIHIQEALEEARRHRPIADIPQQICYTKQLAMTQEISSCAQHLLEQLQSSTVNGQTSLKEMIRIAAGLQCDVMSNQEGYIDDFERREQLGSVIMKDYQFAMLHAKTSAVEYGEVLILYPEQQWFEKLQDKVAFVIVMAAPISKQRTQQELLSIFSRSILEYDAFYEAIRQRDLQGIKECFSAYCLAYLQEQLHVEER